MTTPQDAKGIHAHPSFKLGRRPKTDKPVMRLADIRTAAPVTAPIVPSAVDDTVGVTYGGQLNNRFGVCVPVGTDNYIRTTTKLLTGRQISRTDDQIITWYREQNPQFNPVTGDGDGGMIIQDFLAARAKAGDILAFAAVDLNNQEEVREAIWLFLAMIWGVDLQVAQQDQTDAGEWDYKKSGEWGGHCIVVPAYEPEWEDCITWLQRVRMSPNFVANQADEAYVAITQDHVLHPTFREGIDIDKMVSEYERLTGRDFPNIDPRPTPAPPTPAPVPAVDVQDVGLWNVAQDWVMHHRHSGEARQVANALRAWAVAKGLLTL